MFGYRSITVKFIIISLFIIAFISFLIFASFQFTHRIRGDATRINLAGELRFRSFEIVWLLHKILDTQTPEAKEAFLSELEHEIETFEDITEKLEYGNEKEGIRPLESIKAKRVFEGFYDKWKNEIKPMILKILELPEQEARELLDKYDSKQHAYVYEIDSFVTSLENDYKKEIGAFDRYRLYLIAVFVLGAVLIVLYVRSNIVMPLHRLRDAALQIEKGKFDIKTEIASRDEVGELSKSFNQMTQTLNIIFDEKGKLLKSIAALYEMSKDILGEINNIDALLERIADNARKIMGAQYAVVSIFNEKGEPEYFVPSGVEQQVYDELKRRHGLPSGKGLLGLLLKEDRPLRVDDILKHPASTGFPEGHPAMKTFLSVPSAR
jgi:nitrate/nitrite-specific signal transduction histidine kinase